MPVRIRGELVTVPPPREGQRRRLVWPIAESIYRSLSKQTGSSFATDEAIRAMCWQDTGHVFGERSIARARRREARRGTITCKRIKPNRIAGTIRTYGGTVRVRFADEVEKRAERWREKVEARKRRRRELATSAKRTARSKEVVQVGHLPHHVDRELPYEPEALADPLNAPTHIRAALAAIIGREPLSLSGQEQAKEESVSAHDRAKFDEARRAAQRSLEQWAEQNASRSSDPEKEK